MTSTCKLTYLPLHAQNDRLKKIQNNQKEGALSYEHEFFYCQTTGNRGKEWIYETESKTGQSKTSIKTEKNKKNPTKLAVIPICITIIFVLHYLPLHPYVWFANCI